MDNVLKQKLQDFYSKNKNLCLGLNNWLAIQNKSFKLVDALACIYEYANGNSLIMKDIISHIIDSKKRKVQGRANTAYGVEIKHQIDIVPNTEGKLVLQGYNSDKDLQLKGQHHEVDNSKIFKNDGTVNKNYKKSEEKLYNLGFLVRNLYPEEDNIFITHAMQAIKKYANDVLKKTPEKVIRMIRLGKLYYDPTDEQIKPKNRLKTENIANRVIIVTESMAKYLKEEIEMTEYKFQINIKKFLHDLLVDPVNAQVPEVFRYYGYNRSKLIALLKLNDILRKNERIVDKDEFGNDRTATMQIKYRVPKKHFDRKLRNLFIKMFERNVPEIKRNELDEEGCGAMMGGATSAESSGQFSQPLFPMQRRTMYNDNKEIEEDTTTSTVGNYQYDVPFVGDKETLSRKNGKGGSVSINNI